jgi:threonine/homoserine/homoserine lactone efflux protein
MSIDFLIVTFIVVASPGTGVLFTLAAALARGSRAGVVAAFGCTLGIVPHMVAAILGLSALLRASEVAFQTFKYLGVAYLLYLAWSVLRERGALKVETEAVSRPAVQVVVTAVLINLLNPKLTIFFVAFLPQFLSVHESHPLTRLVELSAAFMLMTFAVFVAYAMFAALVRNHVVSRPGAMRWIRRSFAGAFVVLGAKLALTDR